MRSKPTLSHALLATMLASAPLFGCSSKSSSATPGDSGTDGGGTTESGVDGGGNYPAFMPDVPQIQNKGGPQLTSPKLVTVTWTADSNEATFEDFDDKIGASAYWQSTVKEYGVGAATSGAANHVRISAAPMGTIDVLDLETWFGMQVMNAGTNGWPAYDPQTLYVVWIPPATKVTAGGMDACIMNEGSVHSATMVGANDVPYVFVDENCNGSQMLVDYATEAASHAIAEAVTDPHLNAAPAVIGFDAQHIAWQMWQGTQTEIADICFLFADAYFKGPSDLPYSLQRLWSNASAMAGHNPCTPVPTDPYYNVALQNLEMLKSVVIGTATKAVAGLGYDIPVGSSKTINFGYFSDAPLGGPITLSAVEGDGWKPPASPQLTIAVGTGMGNNGDMDSVTVTVNPGGNAPGNAFQVTLVSSVAGLPSHYMPILIEAL